MKSKGVDCVNSKAYSNVPYSLLTPVTRDCSAVCVCVFEEAGRDHLVLEDLGLMKQIQHQHQLSGTRHQQSDACDADSKSPEAAATV